MNLRDQKAVVFDLETSGLYSTKHEIIEVGYVLLPEWEGVHFSLPFDVSKASPEALEVNGWGKREFAPMVDAGPKMAAERLLQDFADRFVVASPAHFDVGFLTDWVVGLGLEPTWSHRMVLDLKSLFAGFHRVFYGFKNSDMAQQLWVNPPDVEHTALGDAFSAAQMLWSMPMLWNPAAVPETRYPTSIDQLKLK